MPGAVDGSVKVYSTKTWDVAFELAGEHSKAADIVAWSHDSQFLLSGGMDQSIHVWHVPTRTSVRNYKWDGNFKTLQWGRDDTSFVMLDEDARYAHLT